MQKDAGTGMLARSTFKSTLGSGRAVAIAVAMALAAALASTGVRASDNLRRCEDATGHVTYSNETCPDGTSKERTVENRPAVEIPHDVAGEKAALGAKAGGIVPSGATTSARSPGSAETDKEFAQEKRKSLVARCDDLVRRIEYGQQDLLSAAPGERASVELGVRRLQEEHESLCTPPKQ